MKRLHEISDAELASYTEQQLHELIENELLAQGIKKPKLKVVVPPPTERIYNLYPLNLRSKNYNALLEVLSALERVQDELVVTDWDPYFSHKYQYVKKEKIHYRIEEEDFYSKDVVMDPSHPIRILHGLAETYKSELFAYMSQVTRINDVQTKVLTQYLNAIQTHAPDKCIPPEFSFLKVSS
jgi:hypothetical protein